MKSVEFNFFGENLEARHTGTLWWPKERLLCVSDMHLGKSERIARRGGALLPPYETDDTLARLGDEILELNPKTVVCLGDSFDDLKALDALTEVNYKRIVSMIAGREWIWIEGNHDAGPVDIGGTHLKRFERLGLTFTHIAKSEETAEISGHYHPKTRLSPKGRSVTKPCFLINSERLIMPAFGTYTGGLNRNHSAISDLIGTQGFAILTGTKAIQVPLLIK